MTRSREAGHVHADLGDDHLRDALVNPVLSR
jgi:hypothetical protein